MRKQVSHDRLSTLKTCSAQAIAPTGRKITDCPFRSLKHMLRNRPFRNRWANHLSIPIFGGPNSIDSDSNILRAYTSAENIRWTVVQSIMQYF